MSKTTAPADNAEIVEETTENNSIVKKELRKFLYYATGFVAGAIVATIIVKSGKDETSEN
jgi:hypothetical protein